MIDLIKRLNDACNGHPHAEIPWPHRLLHDARDEITRLTTERDEARAEVAAMADAARGALNLVRTMLENDPNEPISDAGHTCLEAWVYEADRIDAALSSTAETAARHTETIRAEALEKAAQVAASFNSSRHAAHDMHEGTFPQKSEIQTAIASAIRNLAKQEGSK